ncbi:hypothetical protein ACOSQ3_002579 [Xanthoceras sorbifolium]
MSIGKVADPNRVVMRVLESCAAQLQRWYVSNNSNNFRRHIRQLRVELQRSNAVQSSSDWNLELRISSSINTLLDAPFSTDEIKIALFDMYPTKALGFNGFPALFLSEVLGQGW